MARRKKSRLRRFKKGADTLSIVTGLASLGALLAGRSALSSRLLKASALTGFVSAIPSKRGVKRVLGRGKKLSRFERFSFAAKGLGAVGNVLILSTSRAAPGLAALAAQTALEHRASRFKSKRRRKSRSHQR